MITMNEILMGRQKESDLTQEQKNNAKILLERINKVRAKYGKPMKVNDGIRVVQGSGAAKSNHFIAAAIDIDDDDTLYMWKWCLANLDFLVEVGLWLEDPRWTHGPNGTWMHFQIFAPKSGKRIYIPSDKPMTAPNIWDGKYDSKYDKAV